MRKGHDKSFTRFESSYPPAGLFERIISAIKREQELRHTKKLALGFLALLIVSLSAAPFSWILFVSRVNDSGVLRFIGLALSDVGIFLAFWQEFSLAIAESLPVAAVVIFTANVMLAMFTLRLFLYKKRVLVGYLLKV